MIEGLNKAFENRLRLGIMGLLMVNASISFNQLKEELGATDGNLSSHINALEKLHYVMVEKRFLAKKPLTTYSLTKTGKNAFENHIKALENLIRNTK